MKDISITYWGLTDPGVLNKKNEDSYVCKTKNTGGNEMGIFAIADGVGGLLDGDIASRIATNNMSSYWDSLTTDCRPNVISQTLVTHMEKTNSDIRDLSKLQKKKMATTLSSLFIVNNACFIAHIGDSRIYRFRRGVLGSSFHQLTKDHSCLINTEADGRVFQKSVLTECLGYKDTIHPYYSSFPLSQGDIYFLCSDGAYKTITNDKLKGIISGSSDLTSVCHNIVYQAKANNEKDNITVIAVKIGQK